MKDHLCANLPEYWKTPESKKVEEIGGQIAASFYLRKKILKIEMRHSRRGKFYLTPSRNKDVFRYFMAVSEPFPDTMLSDIITTLLLGARLTGTTGSFKIAIYLTDMEDPICPIGSTVFDKH